MLLAGLLAVQVGLFGLTWLTRGDNAAYEAREPLVEMAASDISRIEISDGSDDATPAVVIAKAEKTGTTAQTDAADSAAADAGPRWVVANQHDYPAVATKAVELVEKLAGLKRGWPVAESSSAHARFKVAADDFEKRITVADSDGNGRTIFIGTSPVFRRVHARLEGENAVYTVPFSAFDADAAVRNWLGKDGLKLTKSDITSVSSAGLTITRRNSGGDAKADNAGATGNADAATNSAGDGAPDEPAWTVTLAGGADAGAVDALKLGTFAERFADLSYEGIAGPGAKAGELIGTPDAQFSVETAAGDVITYQIKTQPAPAPALVYASSDPFVFETDAAAIEPLLDVSIERFRPDPPAASDDTAVDADAAGGDGAAQDAGAQAKAPEAATAQSDAASLQGEAAADAATQQDDTPTPDTGAAAEQSADAATSSDASVPDTSAPPAGVPAPSSSGAAAQPDETGAPSTGG